MLNPPIWADLVVYRHFCVKSCVFEVKISGNHQFTSKWDEKIDSQKQFRISMIFCDFREVLIVFTVLYHLKVRVHNFYIQNIYNNCQYLLYILLIEILNFDLKNWRSLFT